MSSRTIFIADDDRHLVEALSLRCRELGVRVETASDAIAALVKIDKDPPEVVILDVNMPSGGGLHLREMMAENPRLAKTPVIILTGCADEQTIRRCHTSCAYYVAKCPDVWLRIEPLLRELCPWIEARDQEADRQARGSIAPTDIDSRVDAIFAALSWDDEFLDESSSTGDSAGREDEAWVLCIDDDDEFAAALQMRLEQQGIHMVRASAGMEGYRAAFTAPAQAILLDYRMPGGFGDYVLRRLKENPVTKDIPVIVLTGEKNKALERTMFNLGAADYLTKPYSWEALSSALTRAKTSTASRSRRRSAAASVCA